MARVGREVPLAPERVADRHERPIGIDPADDERGGKDEQTSRDEDRQQDGQRPHLIGPVTDDLDDELPIGPVDRGGQDADRVAGDLGGGQDLGPGRRRLGADGADARLIRQVRPVDPVDLRQVRDDAVGRSDDEGDGPRCRAVDDQTRRARVECDQTARPDPADPARR